MFQNAFRPLLVLLFTSVFFSCQKIGDYLPKPPKEDKETGCDLQRYAVDNNLDYRENYVHFRKTYDAKTGRVSSIDSLIIDYASTPFSALNVKLVYEKNRVLFVDPADATTVRLIATFNQKNQLTSIASAIQSFRQSEFHYNASGRLSYMSVIRGLVSGSADIIYDTVRFAYDAAGNISSLRWGKGIKNTSTDQVETEDRSYIRYTYDLSEKTTGRHAYLDEKRPFNWTALTLAQVMNFLPDLNPTYKRTGLTAYYSEEEPYATIEIHEYRNHQLDAKGNLVRFEEWQMTPTYWQSAEDFIPERLNTTALAWNCR